MPKLDRSLLATYLRPQWPRVLLLGLLVFAAIGLQLANPQIARAFIDQAQAGEELDRLVRIAVLFLGAVACAQAATVAETYVAEQVGWRTTNALRTDLVRHVLDLDGSFHARYTPGELIERIDGDVSAIAGFFSRFVVSVVGSVVFLAGVLVLLFREDVRIGALLTAFAVVVFVFMTRGGGFVRSRARRARAAASDLSGYLEERLGGLPDIKTSGADGHAMRGLHRVLGFWFRANRAAWGASGLYSGVVGVVLAVGMGAALASSAALYTSGAMTLGTVYLVFRYTRMLRDPLEQLTRQMNSFQQATGGLVRVQELLAVTSRVTDGPGAPLGDGAHAVAFDRVWFAYADEPVLRDVSWRLEPGEVLGLLGRTGSGKTTMSRLLFRLYDPASGGVLLDGTDIREARLDELRSRIGLVTQDVQLFDGTLRDNVTLFDASVPDAALTEIFGHLGLDGWLRELPSGLDEYLGASGRGLSAGEAQLVAMARVFLRDPGLVVLDEASSRLDPATERLLEAAITRLLEGRTGIVIAHRLTTLERADAILVLDDGSVAEFGPRTALAADAGSRYAQLLRAGELVLEELA